MYAHGSASTQGTSGLSREALRVYPSADGGRTFGRPAERVAMNRGYLFGIGNSVVLSDGRWLAVFGDLKAYWDAADSDIRTGRPLPPPPEP